MEDTHKIFNKITNLTPGIIKSVVGSFMPRKFKRKLPVSIGINLTVRDSDVFIVSYPRSGNTWLRFLVGSLYFETKMNWKNIEDFVPNMYRHTDQELLEISPPRFIKSHHPYDQRFQKVIYLVRDVRDVALSYYKYHLKFNDSYSKDFSQFLQDFISENQGFDRWDNNIEGWLSNKEKIEKGFLLVRYEELKNSTRSQVQRIVDFLNLDRSEKEINKAIKWCSFEEMKRLEEKQEDQVKLFKDTNKNVNFVRKGKSGNWKKNLEEKQKEILEEEFSETLQKLGYKVSS